jgi:hypothetical protein
MTSGIVFAFGWNMVMLANHGLKKQSKGTKQPAHTMRVFGTGGAKGASYERDVFDILALPPMIQIILTHSSRLFRCTVAGLAFFMYRQVDGDSLSIVNHPPTAPQSPNNQQRRQKTRPTPRCLRNLTQLRLIILPHPRIWISLRSATIIGSGRFPGFINKCSLYSRKSRHLFSNTRKPIPLSRIPTPSAFTSCIASRALLCCARS